jgi:hypothetical protein
MYFALPLSEKSLRKKWGRSEREGDTQCQMVIAQLLWVTRGAAGAADMQMYAGAQIAISMTLALQLY